MYIIYSTRLLSMTVSGRTDHCAYNEFVAARFIIIHRARQRSSNIIYYIIYACDMDHIPQLLRQIEVLLKICI